MRTGAGSLPLDFEAAEVENLNAAPPPIEARTPGGLIWRPAYEAPSQGRTPAAAHASATAAELAKRLTSPRTKRLMLLFLEHPRLTLNEASVLMPLVEKSLCPLWNRLEHKLDWIRGTGEYFTYTVGRQPVKREFHELTARGRDVASELQRGARR
jgi:hypothetical protein